MTGRLQLFFLTETDLQSLPVLPLIVTFNLNSALTAHTANLPPSSAISTRVCVAHCECAEGIHTRYQAAEHWGARRPGSKEDLGLASSHDRDHADIGVSSKDTFHWSTLPPLFL